MMQVKSIPIDQINPDPEQPRQEFSPEGIKNLTKSIAEVGLLQPIIVRPDDKGEGYCLVAGERRWRAAKKAGEEMIMATLLSGKDFNLRQLQLVENLQREDLNPLEKARSIDKYMSEEGLNKTRVSDRLGIPRTTITEWLNILEVEEKYQREVVDNFNTGSSPLTISHVSLARALVQKTNDPTKKKELLDSVLDHDLSREETRKVVQLFDKYFNITVEEAVGAVRLYSSSELLKKQKHSSGEKSRKKLPKELKELEGELEELINNLETILENTYDYTDLDASGLTEKVLVAHQLLERMMMEVLDVSLDSLTG